MAAGVDDYLGKPHHQFQIRSQLLVGLRRLNYIDSVNGVASAEAPAARPAASLTTALNSQQPQ